MFTLARPPTFACFIHVHLLDLGQVLAADVVLLCPELLPLVEVPFDFPVDFHLGLDPGLHKCIVKPCAKVFETVVEEVAELREERPVVTPSVVLGNLLGGDHLAGGCVLRNYVLASHVCDFGFGGR